MDDSLRSPSKSPLSVLVVQHGSQVVAFAEVAPVHVGEVELRVDGLPDHEVGEAFGAGLDDEVGVRGEDEALLDDGLVDVLGVEVARVDGFGDLPDRGRELVFPAETDTDLDGGVDGFGVVGTPDRDLAGRVEGCEFSFQGGGDSLVEDADVDRHALRAVLERPLERGCERVVGALLQEVALCHDEGDVRGGRGVVAADAEREVPVVQTHGTDSVTRRHRRFASVPASGYLSTEALKPRHIVSRSLRRAAVFAVVASLSVLTPLLGRATAIPFAIAAIGGYFVTDGRLFMLLAFPADERDGRLRTFVGFSLASAGLALLVPSLSMPAGVFAATVLAVGYGDLGRELVETVRTHQALGATGFVIVGTIAAIAGQVVVRLLQGGSATVPAELLFLALSGALLAALLRAVFVERDDPLVLLFVALLLWLFADLTVMVTWQRVLVAMALTVFFGYVSYGLGAASVPGMLTGVFLGLLTVVLGGYGWFAILIAFFAIGGLSTKYGYDRKRERGVAEPNEGARGSGNVLGNSAAALLALLLFAAHARLPVPGELMRVAFAGSIATALADTLSSEIGGLFDDPRLVTTLEPVDPGTDGAITWQGELAGIAGAGIVAAFCVFVFGYGLLGVVVIVGAGFAGMTADSLAGATIEGNGFGNQTVNFLATLTGGVVAALLAITVGFVPL